MNRYQRIFGTGPRGLAISIGLLAIAYLVAPVAALPDWLSWDGIRPAVFGLLGGIALGVVIWSIYSLPPSARGNDLCTAGAFRFFRHPLYAAFLTFFNFGLAIWLDDWVYVAWAVLLHPVWHWNVAGEEHLMRNAFGAAYDEYAARTGRFIPAFWRRS